MSQITISHVKVLSKLCVVVSTCVTNSVKVNKRSTAFYVMPIDGALTPNYLVITDRVYWAEPSIEA